MECSAVKSVRFMVYRMETRAMRSLTPQRAQMSFALLPTRRQDVSFPDLMPRQGGSNDACDNIASE